MKIFFKRLTCTFSVVAFWLMPLSGFSQNKYSLQGNVEVADGTTFTLSYKLGEELVKNAASSKDNKFTIKGMLPEPALCTLSNSANDQIRIFVAENSDMILKGDVKKFFNVTIANAKEDQLYEDFKQKGYQLNGDFRKMIRANSGDVKDKTSKEMMLLHQRQDSLLTAIVKVYPNNIATAMITYNFYAIRPDRVNAAKYLQLMSEKIKRSYFGTLIAQFIAAEKNIVPGNMAPDFALNDLKGKTVRLSDYKGVYVFVDFWASWCGPCREENPTILKCYSTYASDTLKFLGVSLDANAVAWKKAVETDQLPWTQLNDPEATSGIAARLYGIRAIPFNFLLDPSGKIIAMNLRGGALEVELKKLVK